MLETDTLFGKLKKNTWYNFSSKIVQVVLALLLIPFIIRTVGVEVYGIWAVIQVSTILLGCLDPGVNGAYIKFFSEQYKERGLTNSTFSTGITCHLVLAAPVILAVFLLPVPTLFIRFFDIPSHYFDEVEFALKVNTVFFFVSNTLQVFHHFLVSAGRQDITNRILIVSSVINLLTTVFVLELGLSLYGLAASYAFVQLVTGGMFFLAVTRIFPGLDIRVKNISTDISGRMFKFGRNIQLCHVADLITLYSDRLLVGLFFSVELAGFYHVGATLVNRLRETPNLFLSALLPVACRFAKGSEKRRLIELYENSLRKLIKIIAPLFLFIAGSAPLLIFIWMGRGYNTIACVTAILTTGSLIGVLSGTGCVIGQAVSRPDIQMKTGLLTAAVNIVLSLILAKLTGFYGISIATLIAFAMGSIYFFAKFHKELSLPSLFGIKGVVLPLFLSFLSASALFPLNLIMLKTGFIAGQLSGFIIFCAELALFAAFYAGVMLASDSLVLRSRARQFLSFSPSPSKGEEL